MPDLLNGDSGLPDGCRHLPGDDDEPPKLAPEVKARLAGGRRFAFWCQKCGAQAPVRLTVEQGYDPLLTCHACGATGKGTFDDMPPDVEVNHAPGDEGEPGHFDRYQAGDR
jgi:hypothetical protein